MCLPCTFQDGIDYPGDILVHSMWLSLLFDPFVLLLVRTQTIAVLSDGGQSAVGTAERTNSVVTALLMVGEKC